MKHFINNRACQNNSSSQSIIRRNDATSTRSFAVLPPADTRIFEHRHKQNQKKKNLPAKKKENSSIDFLAPSSRTRGWQGGGKGWGEESVFAERSSEGGSERLLFRTRQTKQFLVVWSQVKGADGEWGVLQQVLQTTVCKHRQGIGLGRGVLLEISMWRLYRQGGLIANGVKNMGEDLRFSF